MTEDRLTRILIVDDDADNIVLLTEILSQDGHKILTAKNGIEALDVVRRKDVHLVISDIRMPKMDGIVALKEIKKIKPKIEVILMTAFGEVESYLDAIDLGAFEYFNKPLDIKDFRRLVNKALSRSASSSQEDA